jgi:hypothetical protein
VTENGTTGESFFAGIRLGHSKSYDEGNTLPAVLAALHAACAGTGHYAAAPGSHILFCGHQLQDLHPTLIAIYKNWHC